MNPTIEAQRSFYDARWDQESRRVLPRQHVKNRHHVIVRILKRLRVENARFLEAGCGLGTLAGKLARFGRVTAIDLSPYAIRVAREQYPNVRFLAGDIMTNPLAGEQFELVVSSEVIEHLPVENRERFVDILGDYLAPGGRLLLTTPNRAVSCGLKNDQVIEEHFDADELKALLNRRFSIELFTTCHRLFPVKAHRSRFYQALRLGIYDGLKLRPWIENPFRKWDRGLYFVVLARKN